MPVQLLLRIGMNCSVSAGPAMHLPGVKDTGPQICESRMPRRLSSALAVALSIAASPSTRCRGGRVMSGVWLMCFAPDTHRMPRRSDHQFTVELLQFSTKR
jgi:hypothetical protein